MKRGYLLAASLDQAEQAVEVLHDLKIDDAHIHVLSQDTDGVRQHHLHAANMIQRTDLVRGAELGALNGLGVGLVLIPVSLMAAIYLPLSIETKQLLLLGVTIVPILLCALAGAVVGACHESYKIAVFHEQLVQGRHLILVDSDNIKQLKSQLLARCPLEDVGDGDNLCRPFDDLSTVAQARRAA